MKLILDATVLLLISNASVVFGSSIRGGAVENEQERNLARYDTVDEENGPSHFGQPSKFEKADTHDYDCEEGCKIGKGSPVCGDDGNTYINECLAVCQDVVIIRNGNCPSGSKMNIESFFGEGKVTKKEMNAFKAEKFKLVAKRKPRYGDLPDMEEPLGDGRGPGNDNGKPREQRSARVARLTKDGLEYVAEYDMDSIPKGVSYDSTKGDIPETAGDKPEPDGFSDRRLSVLGDDTRYQETSFAWPWPKMRITALDYDERQYCSGAIIGPNKVLTAASCVYNLDSGSWRVPNRVAPGRSGSRDPWGKWDVKYATIYTDWMNGKGWEYDIAVLTIEGSGRSIDTDIGFCMGHLGMTTYPCSPDNESQFYITGYPLDKPEDLENKFGGSLWNTGVCDAWDYTCDSKKVYHQCDTAGGMTGAPIRDGSDRIIGVHAYGASGGWNSGTAMNSYHLANIENW